METPRELRARNEHSFGDHWDVVLEPKTNLFQFNLREVWQYRDLLLLLVRRDFVATYKQTILGPIWFFLQPLLTTLIYTIIFNSIANISTDGMPPLLFYMAGTTLWNYFADCLNKTSTVFRDNAAIFGKVYFPRLVIPFSIVISNLIKLGIQFLLFLLFWGYYLIATNNVLHPNGLILILPLLILLLGLLGLGMGMIISSMTTKYRDLIFLLTFGVQLLMYATPVIYPLSSISSNYKWLIVANPMTPVIEAFRYAFTGSGSFSWMHLSYSLVCAIVLLFIGIIIFNRVERDFMDTV